MEAKTNKVVDLLRKLIAHERSAREVGSIKEAEAFAEKIQSMLDEHKLGMTDVEWDEREEGEPIGWEHVTSFDEDFPYSKIRRTWQVRLAQAIAECNGCRCVLACARVGGNGVSFVGRTSDRELCKVLFIYMLNLATDLNELNAKQDAGEQKFKYINSLQPWEDFCLSTFRMRMKEYKESWFAGFSESVGLRFYAQREKTRTQAKASGAIVHIDKEALALNDYMKGKTRPCGAGRRTNNRNQDGYARGKSTGQSVNLSPNTFGSTSGRTSRLLSA